MKKSITAYEDAVEMARDNYHASTLENKGYICMSATVGQQRGGTVEVRLNGVFGKKSEAPEDTEGYFDVYESWPYKFHADGDCEPTIDYIGADDTLQAVMRNELILNGEAAPEGYRTITHSVIGCDFTGADYVGKLFYREDDDVDETCISGDYMNLYFENGIDIIKNIIPESLGFYCDRGAVKVYKVVSLTVSANGGFIPPSCVTPYITHGYTVEYGLQDYMLATVIQPAEL